MNEFDFSAYEATITFRFAIPRIGSMSKSREVAEGFALGIAEAGKAHNVVFTDPLIVVRDLPDTQLFEALA